MALTPPALPLVDPVRLGFGSEQSFEPKTLQADFGDGYTQRAGDGINAVRETYSVTLANLTRAEALTINAFFAERAGWKAFSYTPPGETQPKFYICKKWARQHVDALTESMTCSWTQVFQ